MWKRKVVIVIAIVIINIVVYAKLTSGKLEYGEYKELKQVHALNEKVVDKININTNDDLKKYVYTVDETAYFDIDELDVEKLKNLNLTGNLYGESPKVLILHTHSQELYIDSNGVDEGIIGVGSELANILSNKYGVSVIHDIGEYDFDSGIVVRNGSYENMEVGVKKILDKYPSIDVIIDLHRDGVPDDVKLVTDINGKKVAKVMLFNGVTALNKNGNKIELDYLKNEFLEENLAVSLQMFLYMNEKNNGLMRKIYIKPYRYSLHMRPKSMLIEVGANTNTFEEAKNAVPYIAKAIVEVLGN